MARSLLNPYVPVFFGLAALAGCSSSTTTGTTTGTTTTTTTTSGTGGTGGETTTTTTTTTSTTGTGGMGGVMGTGGMAGAAGTGGAGGSAGGGGMGGMGGVGGMGGMGGMVVVDLDQDGDGWTVGEGDCCDTPGSCGNPKLVNPGAFEYPGNGVDDDCDAATPDNAPIPNCSAGALIVPTSSDDLIKAMDLCQFTTESPPKPQKKWGVISTNLLRADGTSAMNSPKDLQVGVLSEYGPNVLPKKGSTMAALASGTARDLADPGYVHPQNGPLAGQNGNFNAGSQVSVPPEWLAAHNGTVPSPGNCPACSGPTCTQAFDSVDLKARIRVPTNAKSFSYSLKFYTAEYPEFVCQQYNDFFITLLSSTWQPDPNANPPQKPLPLDKNIAFDAQGNAVSVNNGFFEVCFPTVNAPPGACPGGTLELVGTGMGGWDVGGQPNLKDGGGTLWLINDAPVVPGETIEIQWIIWDAGDHNVDSLVLLDKFRWNVTPSPVGVHK